MTFLEPAAGLLGAALAVPALLLFYLLKLRRRPVRVSSTLLWQRAVRDFQANAPFARLRFTALLLLQLLILACLLAAMARPAVPGAGVDARRVVLLIDRSASMSATDLPPLPGGAQGTPTPRSRLDAAKDAARRIVREAPGDQQIMVVAFATDARALTAMTTDRAAALEAIDAIAPTDEPGDPVAALSLVQALVPPVALDEAAGEGVDRAAVVLLSDGSFDADSPNAADPGRSPAAITGLDLRYVPVGTPAGTRDNAGIVALGARRDADDPATVRLFLRLRGSLPAQTPAAITVTLDGRAVLSRTIRLPAATASAGQPTPDAAPDTGSAVGPAPVELPLTLSFREPAGGVVTVSLGRPDLLAADNSASVVLPAPGKPRVVLVAPGAAPAQADASLLSILESLDKQSLRQLDPAGYEAALTLGTLSVDKAGEGGADLVVFDRVRPTRLPPVPSISFGAGIPPAAPPPGRGGRPAPGAVEVLPPSEGVRGVDRFIAWKRDHPIMRFVNPDSVVINPPTSLSFDETLPDGTRAGEVLASSTAGPIIVVRTDARTGTGGVPLKRVVVAFALARSSWPEHVSFLAFASNAVDDLTLRADGQAGRAVPTGTPLLARALTGQSAVSLLRPGEGSAVEVAVPGAGAPGVAAGEPLEVPIGRAERAGVYRLSGVVAADEAIAANLLDATETDLRVEAEFRRGGGGLPAVAGTDLSGGGLGGYRELWWHFILAALVLLCVEWPLYALAARR